jgi:hypothetical protein
MSCLIYQSNSDGCTGRCDANCYNATGSVCDCCCGGRNHGVGYQKALENTRELADIMIEEYAKKKGIDKSEIIVNPAIYQLNLFE